MKNVKTLPIGNYYGNLEIAEGEDGKYYMRMEDCFDTEWEEIPEYVFDALNTYYYDNKN